MIIKVKALGDTHEINVEAWANTFGCEATAKAVRADALSYFRHQLRGLAIWNEVGPQEDMEGSTTPEPQHYQHDPTDFEAATQQAEEAVGLNRTPPVKLPKVEYVEKPGATRAYVDDQHVASIWGPACGSPDWFFPGLAGPAARFPGKAAATAAMVAEVERVVGL